MMGPVKAALESATRYMAAELGPKGILVHAIRAKAPARSLVSIEDVGMATAYLATDYAKLLTGDTLYVDGGYHIID
jgi:enoyl-[acyl-carrier protein] reductase I